MRILITGGAGFIGSNLARVAIDAGHQVTVIDDLSNGYFENIEGLDLKFIEASFLDVDAIDAAAVGQDSIVHLGALGSVPRSLADPERTHVVNNTGTLRVLEAARRRDVPHLVYSSSSSVYGMNPALPKSEREWVRAMSPYAVSKLAAEQYVLAYQQSFGLSSLAFRFFNVYGPGQRAGHAYAAVIPIFLDCMLRGQLLPINGDGTNSRDFTFVGTVVRVLLDAVENQKSHVEPVNLAFGTNTSILSLIDEIESVSGQKVSRSHREPRVGDVPHSQADNASLRSLFPGVDPVPLTQGLAETLAWLSSQE